MKIASYAFMAIGVVVAAYAGYVIWFARGDWLEIGIGAGGAIMAAVGVVLKRVGDKAAAGR